MNNCPQCGSHEKWVKIWDCQEAGDAKFKGWYCSTCQHFEKAIGRERKFEFRGKEKK